MRRKRQTPKVAMDIRCIGKGSSIPFFLTITDKPAISSKGFSNTFRLLEKQLLNNESRSRHTLGKHQPMLSIMQLSKKTLNSELKCCLDLELDVIDRLSCLSKDDFSKHHIRKFTITCEDILWHFFAIRTTSVLFFLYTFLERSKHKSRRLMHHSEIVCFLEGVRRNNIDNINVLITSSEAKAYVLYDDNTLKYCAGYAINGKECLRVIQNCKHFQDEGKSGFI